MDLPVNVVKPDFQRTGGYAMAGKKAGPGHQTESALVRNRAGAPTPTLTAHIPLPGKVWNLAHRRAWQNTLSQ